MTENLKFINTHIEEIKEVLNSTEDFSFLISSSALKQKTYFVSFCEETKKILEEIL